MFSAFFKLIICSGLLSSVSDIFWGVGSDFELMKRSRNGIFGYDENFLSQDRSCSKAMLQIGGRSFLSN